MNAAALDAYKRTVRRQKTLGPHLSLSLSLISANARETLASEKFVIAD
jgi:hypothetical protein